MLRESGDEPPAFQVVVPDDGSGTGKSMPRLQQAATSRLGSREGAESSTKGEDHDEPPPISSSPGGRGDLARDGKSRGSTQGVGASIVGGYAPVAAGKPRRNEIGGRLVGMLV